MNNEKEPPSQDVYADHLKNLFQDAAANFMRVNQTSPERDKRATKEEPPEPDPLSPIRDFNLKPRDIQRYLDNYVIGQDEAKRVLSVAVCDHYNHARLHMAPGYPDDAEYAKHNVVLLGPTGVGKTYLMRCIARLIGVPFVKADATKFSETGYVGHDVEDLVRDLVKAADDNIELAEHGIVYVDEIDKIAASGTASGKDVSGRGVQINLLKLMEDTDVGLFSQTDLIGQMQAVMEMQRGKGGGRRHVSTGRILFIVSGAFDKLADVIIKRTSATRIGFSGMSSAAVSVGECLRQVQTRDLVEYGFEPEFVGRLPVRVVCDPLSTDDLEQILRFSKGSILEQYRQDFLGYGINVDFDAAAIRYAAEIAQAENTGARGLMTVFERVLRGYKFELPSTNIKRFSVGKADIANPEISVQRLLAGEREKMNVVFLSALTDFMKRFGTEFGFSISIRSDLRTLCFEIWKESGGDVETFLKNHFGEMQHGFRIIAARTGETKFSLTKRFIENPKEGLSALVVRYCGKKDGKSSAK